MTDRRSPRSGKYHLMSLHAKQRHVLRVARPGPIRCGSCETQLVAADLERHLTQSCAGSRVERDARLVSAWPRRRR